MFAIRETKETVLAGLTNVVSSKKLEHNTYEVNFENGDRAVRFHKTNIVTFHPDGSFTLNSGGFHTQTTGDRLRRYAKNVRLMSDRGVWYVSFRKDTKDYQWPPKEKFTAFYDGITFSKRGKVLTGKRDVNDKELAQLRKDISRYCKHIREMEVPPVVTCGKPLTDADLLRLVKAGHISDALIYNAFIHCGYRDEQVYMWTGIMKSAEQTAHVVRRYLSERLTVKVAEPKGSTPHARGLALALA